LARLAWPALPTNGVLQAEFSYRLFNPIGAAVRPSAFDAQPRSV
jgi:hypothetical protein